VLSIGSNMGDRLAQLRLAVEAFRPWLRAASSIYETPPWGPVEQDDFLNAVLIVDDPAADAMTWLQRGFACEGLADRRRDLRWGPRTLDVDVIAVDEMRSDDPELTLPHPRAHERAFVLIPWLELDPHAALPQGPIGGLVELLGEQASADVRRREDLSLLDDLLHHSLEHQRNGTSR